MVALRRWGLIVVIGALVAGLTSLAVSKAIAPEYKATAQLYIAPATSPTVVLQDAILGQNLARSYVQLASAEVVMTPVMDQFGFHDLKAFRERTEVTQVRDTSIVNVSFRDSTPERAAQIANGLARSFIDQSKALLSTLQGSATTALEEQINSIQDDIKSLSLQITSLQTEIAASPRPGQSPVPRADLQSQLLQLDAARQTKQQTLAQLLKTRDDIRLGSARAETTVSLWQPAIPPSEADSPRIIPNTILGALLGALGTLLIASVLSYLDDRIRDVSELRERLGIAALGQVGLGPQPDSIVHKLFMRDDPTGSEAEAFRSIRTNVLFAGVDERPRSIVVTSATAGEGKSIVSANLALSFAEAGTPTILVDADLRRPSQHRLFRMSPATGLTTMLTDPQRSLESFRISPTLIVVPSGPLPPNPAEMLSSSRMSQLIEQMARSAPGGIVVIDTSPVLAVADPVALATKVDGTLLVVDSTRTHGRAALRAIESLLAVRAKILGGVLNKVSATTEGYYYYGAYAPPRPPTTERARPAQRGPGGAATR